MIPEWVDTLMSETGMKAPVHDRDGGTGESGSMTQNDLASALCSPGYRDKSSIESDAFIQGLDLSGDGAKNCSRLLGLL